MDPACFRRIVLFVIAITRISLLTINVRCLNTGYDWSKSRHRSLHSKMHYIGGTQQQQPDRPRYQWKPFQKRQEIVMLQLLVLLRGTLLRLVDCSLVCLRVCSSCWKDG